MTGRRGTAAVPAAFVRARTRARDLYARVQIYATLRQRGSRVPFFFRGDPTRVGDDGDVRIGRGVFVDRDAWFSVAPGGRLTIADHVHINRGFVVSCAGQVSIGRNVMVADRVFIGDANHGYADVSVPILFQPMSAPRQVVIEDDCWLGINVCVLGGVTIGRHSVIGANSVVTRDVPSYSVACGNPAAVVKQYDWSQKQWVRTGAAG